MFPCGPRQSSTVTPTHGRRNNSVAPVDATPSLSSSSELSLPSLCKSVEWSSLPPMRQRRSGFAAALSGDARHLYVAGGINTSGELSDAEVFDVARGRWENLPPLNTPRQDCAGVWLPSPGGGLFVVVGGYSENDQYLDSVEAYDPRRGEWRSLPRLQQQRRGHAATVVSGSVYVMGGNWRSTELRSVEMLANAASKWTTLSSQMQKRRNLCAAVTLLPSIEIARSPHDNDNDNENENENGNDHDACVMVLGGADSNTRYASVEFLDTSKGEWVTRPWEAAATATGNAACASFFQRLFFPWFSSVDVISMSQTREGLAAVSFSHTQHTIVAVLGGSDGGTVRERVEFYNVQRNEWHTDKDLKVRELAQDNNPSSTRQPQVRFNGAAVYVPPPKSQEKAALEPQNDTNKDPPGRSPSSSSLVFAHHEGELGRDYDRPTASSCTPSTPSAVALDGGNNGDSIHRILVLGGTGPRSTALDSVRMLTLQFHRQSVDALEAGGPPTNSAVPTNSEPATDECNAVDIENRGNDTPMPIERGEEEDTVTGDDAKDTKFFRLLFGLDVVLQPKLIDLCPVIGNVHHMKLYYTAVNNLYRMGFLDLEVRNHFITEGLKQTAPTVATEETESWRTILWKAKQDTVPIDEPCFKVEAEVRAERDSDFVRYMRRAVRKNAGRINNVEGTLESLASSILLLEEKMEQVNCIDKKKQPALRRHRTVRASLAFLSTILNAVSLEFAGATEVTAMALGNIVDFGDVDHVRAVAESVGSQETIQLGLQLADSTKNGKLEKVAEGNDPILMVVAVANVFRDWLKTPGGSETTSSPDLSATSGDSARREVIAKWVLMRLPWLDNREKLVQQYATCLCKAGFDTLDILDMELQEDDLDFMLRGHKKAVVRWLREGRQEDTTKEKT